MFYSGPEAVVAAERFVPDVVLTDIGLPGFDGWELARLLRGKATTARAMLIAITAYSGDDLKDRAGEAGIDYIFTKPAEPERVLRLLGPAREPLGKPQGFPTSVTPLWRNSQESDAL